MNAKLMARRQEEAELVRRQKERDRMDREDIERARQVPSPLPLRWLLADSGWSTTKRSMGSGCQ